MKYRLGDARVETHPNSWVAPNATLVGKVKLEEGANVWFNAVLRGDNELILIGRNSNVQDGSVVHVSHDGPHAKLGGFATVIGEDVTIGHKAIIHACRIEDAVLIGMGAIVLNGARIGRNSLVGAGALVTEGKEFPDGSLIVGSPAKAVRQLDDAAISRLRGAAAHYVANARRFIAGLTPV